MIREDCEHTVITPDGRFYIMPRLLMLKLVGVEDDDFEGETDFVRRVIQGGGDLIDVESGYYPREVNIIKKWMVDKEGHNEAVIEIRAKKSKAHRFLTVNELTCDEYIAKRSKELGMNHKEMIQKSGEFINEYIKLTES